MKKKISADLQIFISVTLSDTETELKVSVAYKKKRELIRKSVNLIIRISFYREFKNEMTYQPSKFFNKEVTLLKINK